jgi:hypothetical protein
MTIYSALYGTAVYGNSYYGYLYYDLTENISLIDLVTRTANFLRSANESITKPVDTVSRFITLNRNIAETISITDNVDALLNLHRYITETISLSDSANRVFSANRSISEFISLSDSSTRILSANRSMSENLPTVMDTVDRVRMVPRLVNETINLTDSISYQYIKPEYTKINFVSQVPRGYVSNRNGPVIRRSTPYIFGKNVISPR